MILVKSENCPKKGQKVSKIEGAKGLKWKISIQ